MLRSLVHDDFFGRAGWSWKPVRYGGFRVVLFFLIGLRLRTVLQAGIIRTEHVR